MFAKLIYLLLIEFVLIFEKCESCECPVYEEEDTQSFRCMPSVDCYEDKMIRDFCSADFCIEVIIDSDKTTKGAKYKDIIYSNYTFRPLRMIRFSPNSMKALKMHLFFTPTEVSRCGVEVKRRFIYYLCGHIIENNAVITSCDFVKRAEHLSFTERVFFFSGHKKINCLQFTNNYRPVIDYNIKKQFTKAPYSSGENATISELDIKQGQLFDTK